MESLEGLSVHHSSGEGTGSGTTDNGLTHHGVYGMVIETGYTLADANGKFRDRGNTGRSECHRLVNVTYEWSNE